MMIHSAFSFSSTPAKVKPLLIGLTPDAKPVRVKPCSYSASQAAFMSNPFAELMDNGLVYPKMTSPSVFATLIFPKPGLEKWR